MSAFDTEQWSWKRVSEPETYLGFVDNEVVVYPHGGKYRKVYVSVPSDFFSFITATMSRQELDVATKKHIRFFLQQLPVSKGEWVMGFEVRRSSVLVFDLWRYTEKTFPVWAVRLNEGT